MTTFPASVLGTKVELLVNTTWTDITTYVYWRDAIQIEGIGRANEQSQIQPMTLNLTLNNRDGRFTPRNSAGAYYPYVQQNMQIRVSVNANSATGVNYTGFRFWGEVSELPEGWDTTRGDIYIAVQASGVWRRISQDQTNIGSPYTRYIKNNVKSAMTIAGYWPMEDASGSSSLAPGVPGVADMTFSATPQPGLSSCAAFPGSNSLVQLNKSELAATVSTSASPTVNRFHFAMFVPSGGDSGVVAGQVWKAHTSGTVATVAVSLGANGTGPLTVTGFNSGGTQIFTGSITMSVFGIPYLVDVDLTTSGGSVLWAMNAIIPGAGSVTGNTNGSVTGSVSDVTQVIFNPGSTWSGTAVGQCSVVYGSPTLVTLAAALGGWNTENSVTRFERLCTEFGIGSEVVGAGTGIQMGPQSDGTLAATIQTIEDTDGGLLYESADQFGLGYRPLASMQNQTVQATIDYSAAELAQPLSTTYDDALFRNTVTLTNYDGWTWTTFLATGDISINAPPSGVGNYPYARAVNATNHSDVEAVAQQILYSGTVDENRYPTVTIDMARSEVASLFSAIPSLRVGDYVQVTNMPSDLVNTAKSLFIGRTETLNNYTWTLAYNSIPEAPYTTGFNPGTVTSGHTASPGVSKLTSSKAIPVTILPGSITGSQIATGTVTGGTGGNIANQTVTGGGSSGNIASATVTGTEIATQTITGGGSGGNIAALTITAAEIQAATITGAKLANATITATQIASATITATQIANATITTIQISGSAAITGGQIAAATITGTNIASATVAAGNIVNGTITATQIAAATITATQIANATITSAQISASANITGSQIANATITTTQISATAGITGGQIASATITSSNIASLTINAGNIANLTITASQIANVTITGAKVAANTITGGASGNIALTTITAANIVANTITAAQITAGTITTTEIAASTITSANIATGAITAGLISAGAIDGQTINGVTINGATINATSGGVFLYSSAGGTVLNANPNFLTGITNWTAALGGISYTTPTINSHDTMKLLLSASLAGAYTGEATSEFEAVTAGSNYLATFIIQTSSAVTTTSVGVLWYNSSSVLIGVATVANPSGALAAWTTYSAVVTAPAGATQMKLFITGNAPGSSSGTAFVNVGQAEIVTNPALAASIAPAAGTDPYGNAYPFGVKYYGASSSYVFMGAVATGAGFQMGNPGVTHSTIPSQIWTAPTTAGTATEQQWLILSSGKSGGDDAAIQLVGESFDATLPARAVIEFGGTVFATITKTGLVLPGGSSPPAVSGSASLFSTTNGTFQVIDGQDLQNYGTQRRTQVQASDSASIGTTPVTIQSFTVAARTYRVHAQLYVTCTSAGATFSVEMGLPASSATQFGFAVSRAGTFLASIVSGSINTVVTAGTLTANPGHLVQFDGLITPASAGTFNFQVASGNATTLVVNKNSFVELLPV